MTDAESSPGKPLRSASPRGRVAADFPLAPLTTWRIGGPAARLAAPGSLEDVWGLMRLAYDRGWPLFFLGRGSNVLINDAGLPGLTLHLAKSLQHLTRHGDTLRAGAGVSLPRLGPGRGPLRFCRVRVSGRHPRHRGRGGAPQRRGRRGQPGRGPEPGLGGHASTPTPGIDPLGTGPGLPFLSPAQLPPLAGGGGGIYPGPPRRPRGHPGPHGGLNRPTQNPAARQPQKLRQRL